jgi:hypothetical protein
VGTVREAIERQLATAPADIRDRFRWLPAGTGADISV